MVQSVTDAIAEAAGKTAKDLGLTEEEVVAEQSGEEEASAEETTEEETPEEVEAEEGEAEVEPVSKKTPKMVPMERFNEVYGKMKQMERYLQHLAAQPQQQPKPEPVKEEPLPDLDELTNKELYSFILKNLGKEMKGALKEAVSPLAEFVDTSRQERADREVAGFSASHPDYFDYADKMIEISNRNAQLTVEEVYLLAKGDKGAVTKSVVKRQKEKMLAKKKANVEKRSTSEGKITENTEFKTVREAGIAMAKKLGLT